MPQTKESPAKAEQKEIISHAIVSQNSNFMCGFIGTVAEFRHYLKAERVLMKYGWFGGMKR